MGNMPNRLQTAQNCVAREAKALRNIFLLGSENLAGVFEAFKLQRIARRVEKEHGRLFANVAFKANIRRDDEICLTGHEALLESVPVIPL